MQLFSEDELIPRHVHMGTCEGCLGTCVLLRKRGCGQQRAPTPRPPVLRRTYMRIRARMTRPRSHPLLASLSYACVG